MLVKLNISNGKGLFETIVIKNNKEIYHNYGYSMDENILKMDVNDGILCFNVSLSQAKKMLKDIGVEYKDIKICSKTIF